MPKDQVAKDGKKSGKEGRASTTNGVAEEAYKKTWQATVAKGILQRLGGRNTHGRRHSSGGKRTQKPFPQRTGCSNPVQLPVGSRKRKFRLSQATATSGLRTCPGIHSKTGPKRLNGTHFPQSPKTGIQRREMTLSF